MAPKAPPPPPPPPAAAAAEGEPELPDGVYRKEISEEQLGKFYEAAYTSHEEMIKFSLHLLLPPSASFVQIWQFLGQHPNLVYCDRDQASYYLVQENG
ncbi:hypothetical protein KC19_11G091300 [Ceratodon purpureus]|uniref:Uncharacterized protein n=1 Tax=Ceratodon purpureus TaxID=3225 RepID=A0A8T0GE47_CERPU|nr:hypothetical protein KC19_11G091300 [Ceratodon purpureus]